MAFTLESLAWYLLWRQSVLWPWPLESLKWFLLMCKSVHLPWTLEWFLLVRLRGRFDGATSVLVAAATRRPRPFPALTRRPSVLLPWSLGRLLLVHKSVLLPWTLEWFLLWCQSVLWPWTVESTEWFLLVCQSVLWPWTLERFLQVCKSVLLPWTREFRDREMTNTTALAAFEAGPEGSARSLSRRDTRTVVVVVICPGPQGLEKRPSPPPPGSFRDKHLANPSGPASGVAGAVVVVISRSRRSGSCCGASPSSGRGP